MAIRYAITNGPWSSASTWDGGVSVPGVGDDVFSNNFTVTIDISPTVLSISNSATTGVSAGGVFNPNNNITLTLTGTGVAGPTNNGNGCFVSTLVSPQSCTINGNCNGGTSSAGGTTRTIINSSSGTLNIIGNLSGGNPLPGTGDNITIIARNSSSGTINITGNCDQSSVTINERGSLYGIENISSGTINLYGNLLGGNIGAINPIIINANIGIINYSIGTVTVNGSVSSGTCPTTATNSTVNGIRNAASGTVNIIGNCTGGGTYSICSGVANVSTGTVTITGSCNGGSTGGPGALNLSTGVINITASGSLTSIGTGTGAVNSSTGTINITGTCTGANGSTGNAFVNNSTGTITHIGTAQASATAPAISYGVLGQNTILTGPLLCSPDSVAGAAAAGVNPCVAQRWFPKDTALSTFVYQMKAESVVSTARSDRNMYFTDAYSATYPAITNVRTGTNYGVGNIYTGTMAVPPAASVAYGVPVDNTTGTLTVSAIDFWNYPMSGITTSGTIGERLKTAATVNVVSQLISDSFSAR